LQETGEHPPCLTERGCPIGEDIAADVEINHICNAFIKKKQFDSLGTYPEFAKQIMDKTGLTDEGPELILAMEAVYFDYVKVERKKKELQHKAMAHHNKKSRRR